MPELRRGARCGRVTGVVALNQLVQQPTYKKQSKSNGKTRKAVAAGVTEAAERPRTRLATRKLKEEDKVILEENPVIVISKDKGKEVAGEEEKKVMAIGNDSGGSNKAAAQEEEGNTAPFPERLEDHHYIR